MTDSCLYCVFKLWPVSSHFICANNYLMNFDSVKHVEKAVEAYAVETLLISDALFRSHDLEERMKYVRMVDSVRENMGTVRIFSSLHISGERTLFWPTFYCGLSVFFSYSILSLLL